LSRSVAFVELPEAIGVSGGYGVKLDLGPGRTARFVHYRRSDLDLVPEFLREVGAAARGGVPPEPPPGAERWVPQALPEVARATAAARAVQAEIRSFAGQVKAAMPRVLATPMIAALCVGLFALMVASGVPVFDPDPQAMYAWGANFGPDVVLDGQVWRLLTSAFLHFGLLHLALNMWCLLSVGPLVERLFGHLGFAALYLLAGVGGSLASLWAHPVSFGAGASGAIFGVFGGLLAFLAVHRHVVPPAVLKPLRASAISCVAYNTLYGLMIPAIDNAAHLGGLATGFACGLLLQRPWPPGRGSSAAPRRLVAAGALAGGLALAYALTAGSIRARIEDHPFGQLLRSSRLANTAYNGFVRAIEPGLHEFESIVRGADSVIRRLDRPEEPAERIMRDLDRLIAEADANARRLRGLAVQDAELREALGRLASAQEHLGRALEALRSYQETGDEALIQGPDGYDARLAAYRRDADSFRERCEGYIKAHHLTIDKP
jgi:rhomboid protease GluP